jgi:hypothetical protein
VDDQQRWQRAIASTFEDYRRLPAGTRFGLDELIARIMQLKQELSDLVLASGSGDICRSCGGQCCLNGKYHVTILDLLTYCSAGVEPVKPDFGKRPLCPYGGTDGCLMAPRFRSMTCLIFNCELLEDRMGADDKHQFTESEQKLRRTVIEVEKLLGYRAGRALLLSWETSGSKVEG